MTSTLRRPLSPGESRLTLNPQQQRIVHHLVAVAAEHPAEFGGISEMGYETRPYRQLCASLKKRLEGAGTIVLTKAQREFLHSVLDRAVSDPAMFGGRFEWFTPLVEKVVSKLPPRGAGTY